MSQKSDYFFKIKKNVTLFDGCISKLLSMKRETIFKETLLISQEDMAILLGVSRSHYTMYTLGQRGLPLQAKLKLEQLIMSNAEVCFFKKEKLSQVAKQEDESHNALLYLLQENKFKQVQLQRKIELMETKFKAAVNTLHFVNHIKNRNKCTNTAVFNLINMKANKILSANGLIKQEACKIKLEVLQFEEQLLKKRKQKL